MKAKKAKATKEAKDIYAITGNLNYWCKSGKIREAGNGFVVEGGHKAFFGIEA